MRLVYTETGELVKVGDKIKLNNGRRVKVMYFAEPHKSSSQGKVTVAEDCEHPDSFVREYYVGVIKAKWINRGNF